MEKISHNGNWKKEAGLTLIETVVALSVITIVSVSAASISIYSLNSISSMRVKEYFVRETNSIANLFLSYNETNYTDALNNLTNNIYTISGYDNIVFYYDIEGTYLLNSTNATYQMSLDYDISDNTKIILEMKTYRKSDLSSSIYSRSVTRYV